jgi:hypothetical protein
MSTQQVPVTADYYGGLLIQYIQGAINSHKQVVANQNTMRTTNFQAACTDWLFNAGRARDFNMSGASPQLPMPPKPVCQPILAVQLVYVAAPLPAPPAADDKFLTVNVTTSDAVVPPVGLYVWEEPVTAPVCADLPPFVASVPVNLMGQLVGEAPPVGTPTIVTVDVLKQQTDSAGHLWIRVA